MNSAAAAAVADQQKVSADSQNTNNNNNVNNNNNNNTNTNNNNNNNAAGTDHAAAPGTNAILQRLKEIEANNQALQSTVERLQAESQLKEEKIKDLSADKRKDMEKMIETAIDNWLNSLTDVSEDVRKQFRQGISRIAEQADMKNAAWEIVCNASSAHCQSLDKINELIKTCNEQGETIKSLLGGGADPSTLAASDSSSSSSRLAGQKRGRMNEEVSLPQAKHPARDSFSTSIKTGDKSEGGGDAWDLFTQMMHQESRANYY